LIALKMEFRYKFSFVNWLFWAIIFCAIETVNSKITQFISRLYKEAKQLF